MILRLLAEENYWLLLVFTLYLITILIFSVIYYAIYLRNPQSFSFNVDVLKSQSGIFKSETEKEIALLTIKLAALKALLRELNGAPISFPKFQETKTLQIKDFRFGFTTFVVVSDTGSSARITRTIDLYDVKGSHIFGIDGDEFPHIIKKLEKKLDKLKKRLMTLSTATPMVWSYWDFLYFSVITQATVGYGDILPNSTFVRMLVAAQTLIALLFLVVIINLVFQKS